VPSFVPDPQIRSLDQFVDPAGISCKPTPKTALTLQGVSSRVANHFDLIETGPATPIAAELYAHFAAGGTVAEGVRLVELLERGAQTVKRHKESAGRGSRLPSDWQPSHTDTAFALDRGMPQSRVSTEAEKFRNYWTAKSGAGATKRDWSATWRNWIINAMERGNGPASYRGQGPATNNTPRRAATGSDAILAGMGRLARRVDERRTKRRWRTGNTARCQHCRRA
jgi:hypothetical protein